jgi:cellulose synthase/poly-beta-1,6-N-acetylglucosamine synthase-like glycosyltransferase
MHLVSPRLARSVAIVLTGLVCIAYLAYRGVFTLNWATPYGAGVSLLLYFAEAAGIATVLLFFLQVWDPQEPPPEPALADRTVDVLVTTYDEELPLLRRTLVACCRLEYPHRTYVLDDGGRGEVEALAKELGITYFGRPNRLHAKAGNLNHALARTDGEFIVILDADHVPSPRFITRVLGYFGDERLGFVQTPHDFYNFDSFQACLDHRKRQYWEEGQLFHHVIQLGRNRWNAAAFVGSAAMLRRRALADCGYLATETITEDLHTSLRLHARGWKSLAIGERLVLGHAAPDVGTYATQRLRWAEGNLSILAHDNPFTMEGLRLVQRLCYAASMLYWASGLPKLVIYVTPILVLFTGVRPVRNPDWTLVLITVVYLGAGVAGVRRAGYGYGAIWRLELFCMINCFTQIRATFRAVFRRASQTFVVTKKRTTTCPRPLPFLAPLWALAALSLAALGWAWGRLASGSTTDYARLIVPSLWIVFHLALTYAVTRRACRAADLRAAYRYPARFRVSYDVSERPEGCGDGQSEAAGGVTRGDGWSVDISSAGLSLVSSTRVEVGSRLHVVIHGLQMDIACGATVHWVQCGVGTSTASQGFRHGLSFGEMPADVVDSLERLCMECVVPRLYDEYCTF